MATDHYGQYVRTTHGYGTLRTLRTYYAHYVRTTDGYASLRMATYHYGCVAKNAGHGA